jgi:hypothetical protein
LNTCPRWDPQRAHFTSSRVIPWYPRLRLRCLWPAVHRNWATRCGTQILYQSRRAHSRTHRRDKFPFRDCSNTDSCTAALFLLRAGPEIVRESEPFAIAQHLVSPFASSAWTGFVAGFAWLLRLPPGWGEQITGTAGTRSDIASFFCYQLKVSSDRVS